MPNTFWKAHIFVANFRARIRVGPGLATPLPWTKVVPQFWQDYVVTMAIFDMNG